jgi:hypothetical protein
MIDCHWGGASVTFQTSPRTTGAANVKYLVQQLGCRRDFLPAAMRRVAVHRRVASLSTEHRVANLDLASLQWHFNSATF